ncbi:unnamed protein product [Paramecium primaurelia]|uniref:Uncharacterized protein n=2 Tax=Paramecium TaxID=5884 RepID=A0A8S1WIK2_9CILI|nr:unnamed protein product [Paramecium primaurelia]CAD8188781.1 unnamed protein product [Paramecium pentaurelia]
MSKQPEYILDSYKVPYYLQDSCVDEYVYYQQCLRHNPRFFENKLIHSLPFASALSNCAKKQQIFVRCQEYRERELFEEMRKIYVDSVRKGEER